MFSSPIPGKNLEQKWMFLERNGGNLIDLPTLPGKELEAAKEFMLANELPMAGEPFSKDNIVFVPVDANGPGLELFYSWKDIVPGTHPARDVWRSFLWMAEPDILGVNNMLKEIQLSEGGDTVYSAVIGFHS